MQSLICEHITKLLNENRGLYDRKGPFFITSTDYNIQNSRLVEMELDVKVEMGKNKNVLWWLNTKDLSSISSVSLSTDRGTRPLANVFKTKHDLISEEIFKSSTDTRMDAMFPYIGDGIDHLTPDIILDLGDYYLVIELATVASHVHRIMKGMYDLKVNKYSSGLVTRGKKTSKMVVFFVMVVSATSIIFPVDLPPKMVDTICFAYRLGRIIEINARDILGIEEELKDPRDEIIVKEFKNMLKNQDGLDETDASGYDFTEETYNYYIDYNYDSGVVLNNFQRIYEATAKKYVMPKEHAISKLDQEIENLIKRMTQKPTTRKMKAVVQMPLFIPKVKEGTCPSLENTGINQYNYDEKAILRLWEVCIDRCQEFPERFEENTEKILEVAKLDTDQEVEDLAIENKHQKRTWHRITVSDIQEDLKIKLSLDGLWAKGLKDTANLQNRRLESKSSFHPDTPTDDIEEFLAETLSYNNILHTVPVLRNLFSLLRFGNELAQNKSKGMELIDKLVNTDLFVGLITMQAIATELSVSLKQNVTKREFIHKKIRGLDIELLIHPTKSSSHIFFTVRYKTDKNLGKGVFRDAIYCNGWWYTDLLSSNKSKLDNLLKAPCIWLNSFIHWYMRSDKPRDYDSMREELFSEPEVQYLAKLSLLFSLEDKFLTEEMATGLRYISMQLLKGDNKYSYPTPHLGIKKLPSVMRSRLAVFVFNKIVKYTKSQLEILPIFDFKTLQKTQVDNEADNWFNLLNPYTGKQITKARVLVDLFYIAYTKNKNENAQENSDFQMIKKILDFVFNEDQEKLGKGVYSGRAKLELDNNPDKLPTHHEWCIDSAGHACEIASKRLASRYGKNFKKEMEKYIILECLRKANFETLATMKSSALFEGIPDKFEYEILNFLKRESDEDCDDLPNNMDREEDEESETKKEIRLKIKKQAKILKMPLTAATYTSTEFESVGSEDCTEKKKFRKQCKCIESVIKEIETGIHESMHPIFKLDVIIDYLKETMGGICCYLFKKNQHGGLREIYVLTFRSRICQCFVETVCRCLCSEFQEETMTHPESKLDLLVDHQRAVSESALKVCGKALSRQSAEDKTKWNQNNNVNLYAFILCKLLSKDLSKMCFKILKLWRTKKILIPDGVLNLIINGVPLDDEESLRRLTDEFWHGGGKLIKERGSIFMTTSTGMFQGILHYASSLQHVLQTIHYKAYLKHTYYPLLMACGCIDVEVTTLVSSDDSMSKVTAVIPNCMSQEECELVDFYICMMLHSEDAHSRFFNMLESDKSCLASPTVGEFNSTFLIAESLINPLIKSVYASLSITETESLTTRQESFYNLLKDVYENGGGHFQTHVHQLIQAMFHYSSMGLFPCFIYPEWAAQLHSCPDPTMGFFIMDKDLVAGLLGYNFALYNSLYNTSVPIVLTQPKLLKSGEKHDTRNSVLFLHGNRQRWLRLANNVNVEGWRETLNENPYVMYKNKALNKGELRLKLSAKACSKGVFEALSNSGNCVNIFASSVYCINSPAFTVKSMDLTAGEESRYKRSLYLLQEKAIKLMRDQESLKFNNMTPPVKNVLFPNYILYDDILRRLESIGGKCLPIKVKPYRQRKNKIITRDLVITNPIPLISVLRYKWFNIWVPYGRSIIEYSWQQYLDTYTWLSPNPNVALENSPFNDHVEMYNFFSGLVSTRSKAFPLCRGIRATTPIGQIIESVKYNHFPGVLLDTRKKTKEDINDLDIMRIEINTVKSMRHLISYLLVCPASNEQKMKFLKEVIKRVPISVEPNIMLKIPENMIPTLAFILMLQENNVEDIINTLVTRRSGLLPIFMKDQLFDDKTKRYYDYGKILMVQREVCSIIHVFDNYVIKIETDDLDKFKVNWSIVKFKLSEMGFTFLNKMDRRTTTRVNREIARDLIYLKHKLDENGDIEFGLLNFEDVGIFGFNSPTKNVLSSIKFSEYNLDYEIESAKLIIFLRNRRGWSRIKLFTLYPTKILRFESELSDYWPVDTTSPDLNNFIYSWVYFKSYNVSKVTGLIKTLYDKRDSLGESGRIISRWLKVGLINKLLGRSKIQSKTLELATLKEETEAIHKEKLSQIHSEIFQTDFHEKLKTFIPVCTSLEIGGDDEYTPVNFLNDNDDSDDDSPSEVSSSSPLGEQLGDKGSDTNKTEGYLPLLGSLMSNPIVKYVEQQSKSAFQMLKTRNRQTYYHSIDVDPLTVDIMQGGPSQQSITDRLSDITTMTDIDKFGCLELNDFFCNHPFFDHYVEVSSTKGIWDIINGVRPCPIEFREDIKINCWITGLHLPEGMEESKSMFTDVDFPALDL